MSIAYQIEESISPKELAEVFVNSTIRRPVDDLSRLQQMIDKADLLITARDGTQLIGVARSLTDFCFACYLSDLAVDKAYQHHGIGKELVRLTREAIGPGTMLLLVSAPEAMSYYSKLGFEKMDRAWWINRTR
jgi:ribosomal protein S18 acetylase RimI-like enzyme